MHLEVPLAGLESLSARVDERAPLAIDLHLQSLSGGIVASASVRGRFRATCSRCLAPLERGFTLSLREVFEDEPLDGETYPIVSEEIDLEQALRDLVVPELPAAPLCDPHCQGLCPLCGANRNEDPCLCDPPLDDPRWDVLRDSEF